MPMEEENYDDRITKKRLEAAYRKLQEELEKKQLAMKFLDSKAYERLMNIRSTNTELYDQVINILISVIKTGKVNGKITEEQFVSILSRLTSRPEPTISFKHK